MNDEEFIKFKNNLEQILRQINEDAKIAVEAGILTKEQVLAEYDKLLEKLK